MKVNFLIVGTQKGGTTALAAFLGKHPQICMYTQQPSHPLRKGKEAQFFTNEQYFSSTPPRYDLYHHMFPDSANAEITGESTPLYIYWEPVPGRIYTYNPHMKLIFILRNPVDRAYSHFMMEKQRKTEPLSFSDAIRTEEKRWSDPLSIQRLVYSYVDRGFYTRQIKRMLHYFPKDQMLFIKTEDLKTNHYGTLNRVFDFLNITRIDTIKPQTVFSQKYPEMDIEDRKYLLNKFNDSITDLEQLLGWDCSSWMQ
jgi:hypothetical protein